QADAGDMKLERVPLDIRRVFGDLEMFFREQSGLQPEVALRFELDPALPASVLGDPLRLQQVFINLVENAFKFTEKGSVTVRASVSGLSGGEADIDFAVEDTGIGMSAEHMESIFSAFSQADNSATRRYGGAGIGLTITRQMVELMGGEIGVLSEEGRGTTFSFSCRFALDPDPAAPEGGEPADGAQAGGAGPAAQEADAGDGNEALRGLRVLLAEDNEINTLIAVELMNDVGIEPVTASNGREALERLAEAGGERPFDVVLMDLQMPEMDGYEATRLIKENPEYRDIPICAMTAHAFPEERERCLAMGMAEHLTKPIDVDEFYRALRAIAAAKGQPG
ncbi:MAG: response regulator, partial [Clostridiales Family XIII bacterium]|nr:response regulator [Clostridiales Family XIII bacterium]